MAIPILLDSGIPPEQQVCALTKYAKGNNRSDKYIFKFIGGLLFYKKSYKILNTYSILKNVGYYLA
ncbi:MAG: hypothetical protein CVU08_02070 [Bacteroidetes bacterium HGW-Bacteroidetes-3]|jgi:hypothetical protein|nr:MAG: hypothetical protein CVU08_02070 [Bacteroidetes bacterium HGW-Bacteroidetes-3]